MYVAELRFFWEGGDVDRDAVVRDAVNAWLAALFNNGQLVGEWPGMALSGAGELTAPILLPTPDALTRATTVSTSGSHGIACAPPGFVVLP